MNRSTRSASSFHGGSMIAELNELKSGAFYPFFDQLTQRIDLPSVLHFLVILWIILQNIVIVLWIPDNPVIPTLRSLDRFCSGLFMVATFTTLNATQSSLIIPFVISTGLFVATLVFVGILLVSFMHRRRFVHWLLFIARGLIEIVPILIFFPAAAVMGLSAILGFSGGKVTDFVFLAVSAVVLIGYIAIYNFSYGLFGCSPYLARSPFAPFDSSVFCYQIIGLPAFFVLGLLGAYFESWFMYLVIVGHIGFSAVLYIAYLYRPFVQHWVDNVFSTICIYGILMDLLALIIRIAKPDAGLVVLILVFIFFAVAGVIVFFVDRMIGKRTAQRLFVDPEEGPLSEEESFQRFDDLELCTSVRGALFYLNHAVAHHNMKFYDLFYMKYIISHYRTAPVLSHCARVISWLPYCARPLNYLCRETLSRRDVGTKDRFVLFQLQRIRLLRESSASSSAAEKLATVRTASSETIQLMRAFWERSECNMALLNRFAKQLSSADSLWHEAIEDFPNSVQFRDVFISYLIEAATRYSQAVFQKSRSDMIENGINFRVDDCFRRFVRMFPEYLKEKIVDTKGNVQKRVHGKSEHASGSSHGILSGDVLDIGIEEGIGRQIIGQARVRLTVERAFESRRATSFPGFVYGSVFCMAILVGCFIGVDLFFTSYFDSRGDVANRISYLNQGRLNFMMCLMSWIYYWGTNQSVIRYNEVIDPLIAIDSRVGHMDQFIPVNKSWDERAIYFNLQSRGLYESLMASVVTMAQAGMDLVQYAGQMFSPDALPVYFCNEEGRPAWVFQGNLRTVWSYLFMQESIFQSIPDPWLWFSYSEPVCVLLSSFTLLPDPLTEVRISLSRMADTAAEDSAAILRPLKFALPLGLFGFCLLVFGIVSCMFVRELNLFASLLLNLPKQVKRECTKPIRRDRTNDEGSTGQPVSMPPYSLPMVFNTLIIVVMAGSSVCLFFQVLNLESYNALYAHLNYWVVTARGRKSHCVEAALGAILGIISSSPNTANAQGPNYSYLNEEPLIDRARQGMNKVIEENKGLLQDDEKTTSTYGYNEEIDSLTLSQVCEANESDKSYHEMYRCSSALQLMQYHTNCLMEITLGPRRFNGTIWDGEVVQMIHLLDYHLLPMLIKIDDIFGRMTDQFRTEFVSSHELFFILELVMVFLDILLIVAYCWTVNSCYGVLLTLMRRVSPVYILASEPLESYLLNKSSAKKREGLTADERIIDNSADPIICMGSTGVVDMINPAVTKTFGYTPEQLLGQPLVSLLTTEQSDKIGQQLKLMAEHQSGPLFEGHTTCLTDDDQEVPCSLSLLAITRDDEVSSFVAILKDESELLKQQQEADAAKKQSETLLYQILPRDIVARLNAGEQDISFQVPSATIMFIDIVKFSEYAANLTPQEIMGNLSLIFAGFDESTAKHPLLIKIKLIGDVYMSAGGLFNPDAQPSAHAEQMIRSGLEALQIVEDVNVKLNALLAVRIGVNSGGPIIAGVLGTDKPAFDIIGDPINVAARLQTTDLPGKIQISEDTHALISGMDFQVEYRGEIELKGKGKKKTYLVEPAHEPSTFIGMSASTLEDFARFVPDTG